MHSALRTSDFLPRASNAASVLFRSRSAAYPRTAQLARLYATYRDVGGNSKEPGSSSNRPKKRGVGVLADDGRYEWGELTVREKFARATQQSVNFAVVCVGAVLTVSLEIFAGIGSGSDSLDREVFSIYSTPRSFPRIARHGSLRRRLSASRMTSDAEMSSVTGKK